MTGKKRQSPHDELRDILARFRDVPARDSEAEAAGKQDFLKRAAVLKASVSRPPQPFPAERPGRLRTFSGSRSALLVSTGLAAAFLALVLFFGGSAVTVYAAQDSLPGEALYGIKTLGEDLAYWLPLSALAKVDLTLGFTDRRMDEIIRLHSDARPIPDTVFERYQNELDLVMELTAGMDDADLEKSLERASSHTEAQLGDVARLLEAGADTPGLVQLQNRLKEQAEKIELGKAAPEEFRSTIREEQREESNPGQTPDTPERSEPTRENPEQKTPSASGGDRDGGKPTQDRERPRSYQGTIAAVDAGSLTLTLRDGSVLTFLLTADTRIEIGGLGRPATAADLKVGDEATVEAKEDGSGALVAVRVDVRPAKQETVRYSGTVTDYQAGASITIRERGGTSLTFLIIADTRIKFDPKDEAKVLEAGSNVEILAVRDASAGTLTAQEISVRTGRTEGHTHEGGNPPGSPAVRDEAAGKAGNTNERIAWKVAWEIYPEKK